MGSEVLHILKLKCLKIHGVEKCITISKPNETLLKLHVYKNYCNILHLQDTYHVVKDEILNKKKKRFVEFVLNTSIDFIFYSSIYIVKKQFVHCSVRVEFVDQKIELYYPSTHYVNVTDIPIENEHPTLENYSLDVQKSLNNIFNY